eukprot:3881737-Amphidinium_carterae.1
MTNRTSDRLRFASGFCGAGRLSNHTSQCLVDTCITWPMLPLVTCVLLCTAQGVDSGRRLSSTALSAQRALHPYGSGTSHWLLLSSQKVREIMARNMECDHWTPRCATSCTDATEL